MSPELTILMPCLDEAETLANCIREAKQFFDDNDVDGEVLIADNGSTDGSREIAVAEGARVVPVDERGYGAALIGGIGAARGTYVAMGDADESYDFSTLMPFLERLRDGDDLVMGNRFRGGIEPGAMPALHKYLGNPVLSFIGRLFFRIDVGDFHCGLRAFRRDAILDLELQTTGMEFASEMVVKASLADLRISEVPTPLRKDGRSRPPHLRSWRDGWRHLRFLLMYSPRWFLLYPGIALTLIGLVFTVLLVRGSVAVGGVAFDIGTLLYAVAFTIIGYQTVVFAILGRVYAQESGFLPVRQDLDEWLGKVTLERTIAAGFVILAFGIVASIASLARWRSEGFGDLVPDQTIRGVVPAVLGLVLGSQTVLGGVFLSILRIGTRRQHEIVVSVEPAPAPEEPAANAGSDS